MKIYIKNSIGVESIIDSNKECNNLFAQMESLLSDFKWKSNPEGTLEKMLNLVGGTCTYERKNLGKKMREYPSDYRNSGKAYARMCKSDILVVKYTISGSRETIKGDKILPITKNDAGWIWRCFAETLVEDYYIANIGDVNHSGFFDNMSPEAINEFNRIHP